MPQHVTCVARYFLSLASNHSNIEPDRLLLGHLPPELLQNVYMAETTYKQAKMPAVSDYSQALLSTLINNLLPMQRHTFGAAL